VSALTAHHRPKEAELGLLLLVVLRTLPLLGI
jgi:hypothetical protein